MTQLRPQKALNQSSPKTPAPFLGMNTQDAYWNMPIQYAISADNCVANPTGGLSLRQGYQTYSTGFSSPVTSLMVYNARNNANNKMFAVSGGSIYDASASGAIGAAVVTGLSTSNVYWQSAHQVNVATTYMICVNGTDYPQLYNGSTWTACSQTASPSAPGQFSTLDNNGNTVNIQNFIDVELHCQRWWFTNANSTIAYYLPIGQVGGQLYAFDFGTVFPRGGFLQKLVSWTYNMGIYGSWYNLVAISSFGDIAIYTGDDPSQEPTFKIAGKYALGAPVGQRCTCQLAGDVAYLSQDGLYTISSYTQNQRGNAEAAMTYKITPTITNAIAAYGNSPGWQPFVYPAGRVLILNVPQASQATNIQYIYNLIQGVQGWTRFTNWPAQCWALFNNVPYFGGTNYIGRAFYGYLDGVSTTGTGGTGVTATVLQAPTDLGMNGYKKAEQIRPFFVSGQPNISISASVNTNFSQTAPSGTSSYSPPTGSVWGTGDWGTATWGSSQVSSANWVSTPSSPGEFLSIALSFSSSSSTTWLGTDWNVRGVGSRFG